MKICAIMQARCGSQRFPGKVLMPLPNPGGRCVAEHIASRVRECRQLHGFIVATTTDAVDDKLADLFTPVVFRGSLSDVLDRYYRAAVEFGCDIIVRLTGDNPCVFASMIDELVETLVRSGHDYARLSGIPLGLHAEVFTMHALQRAHEEAQSAYEREHVTPYFYGHPELFQLGSLAVAVPPALDGARLTLDYPSDYALLNLVYGTFPDGPPSLHALAAIYEAWPWIREINRNHQKNDLDPVEQTRAAIGILEERELHVPADALRRILHKEE